MDQREGDKGTLLIVEDDEDTRELMREYLEQFGYSVETGVDGAEGIEKARARAFDLIITDVNMPRMGGLEMIQRIQAIPRGGPGPDVLMLSGDSQIGRAVEAMRLGAVNYLVKPVDPKLLVAEVRAVMQTRRDRAKEPDPGSTTAIRDLERAQAEADARPTRARSAPASDLPTDIGRYQVLSQIGAGGMGTVYKCFDPVLGRTVAVKVVLEESDQCGQEELLQRFACEAQAAGMLRHPNIITVYDYSAEPRGPIYLAMEYLSGQPLGAVIAATGRLPWQRAVGITFQLADALEFAHRNQVIHRDVKPANIIVQDGDAVKILDFGIAKLANSELTVPGTFIGSPRYLAPESFRGARIDYRADQFSLASVLYEMLTGTPAFDFSSFYAGMHYVLSEDPPPLETRGVDVPSLLLDVMARLHQKDPERRYYNEMRLLDDLMELGELAGLTLQLAVPREAPEYLR
jgi:DNA-binding response OmpR family regulator